MIVIAAILFLAIGILIGLFLGSRYGNAGYNQGFEDGVNWAEMEFRELSMYDDDI
jgi:hypothetical protein